jgi:hypothetical protein
LSGQEKIEQTGSQQEVAADEVHQQSFNGI